MIKDLLGSIIHYFNPIAVKDYEFNEMRREAASKEIEEIELFDLSDEARNERIRVQINEAAKTMIPTTEITEGISNFKIESRSQAFYQYVRTMGNIELIKLDTPQDNDSYFIVGSESDSKLIAAAKVWQYQSRIVSVDFKPLEQDSDENEIPLAILEKAQLILNDALYAHDIAKDDLEMEAIPSSSINED